MPSKPNTLIIGAALFLLGILSLFWPGISFGLTSVTFLGAGLALLLLYRTKRKIWSLAAGVLLSYIGVMNFLKPYLGNFFSLNMLSAMFFIVPAIIFLVLFYDRNKRNLLLPACLMLWFGVFILLKDLYMFERNMPALFFACIGLAFLTLYILGRDIFGKWPVFGAAAMGIIWLFTMVWGRGYVGSFFDLLPRIASAALIAVSIIIIVSAIRKK